MAKCTHCGEFLHAYNDRWGGACGPGTACAERRWTQLVHHKQAEIDRLRRDLDTATKLLRYIEVSSMGSRQIKDYIRGHLPPARPPVPCGMYTCPHCGFTCPTNELGGLTQYHDCKHQDPTQEKGSA